MKLDGVEVDEEQTISDPELLAEVIGQSLICFPCEITFWLNFFSEQKLRENKYFEKWMESFSLGSLNNVSLSSFHLNF